MTSGKLNGILYTCTWFPKLGKYNLKNIILILIKKNPIQSYVLCCALCSILFQNMWMFVVYQNKFRPSYIPPYIDSGFTSVSLLSPVYYKIQVCVFNCMGVIKKTGELLKGGTLTLKSTGTQVKKKVRRPKVCEDPVYSDILFSYIRTI